MAYYSYTPGPPLSEFIDSFWLCEDAQSPRKERILPSGTIELVINLREDEVRIHNSIQPDCYKRFPGAIVSGTYSAAFVIDALQHASMLGVHFKPGGSVSFIGALASEVTDTHAGLEVFWGRPALELRTRLCEAATPREKFRLVEEMLIRRLRQPVKVHAAVPMALNVFGQMGGGLSVREAAREAGLSQRQFIRVFTDYVGLTPKFFCRILRFQRARALADASTRLNWAHLAAAAGYFDQSHLIHEFQELCGLSPAEYLAHSPKHALAMRNHILLRR